MVEFTATIQQTNTGQTFITIPRKMMEISQGKKQGKVSMKMLNLDGKEWTLKFEEEK